MKRFDRVLKYITFIIYSRIGRCDTLFCPYVQHSIYINSFWIKQTKTKRVRELLNEREIEMEKEKKKKTRKRKRKRIKPREDKRRIKNIKSTEINVLNSFQANNTEVNETLFVRSVKCCGFLFFFARIQIRILKKCRGLSLNTFNISI